MPTISSTRMSAAPSKSSKPPLRSASTTSSSFPQPVFIARIHDTGAARSWPKLSRQRIEQQLVLTLDSAYQYTDADLADWDVEGPGSTFNKYYPDYYDLALSYGLDPELKPTRLDISETVYWLGYRPTFSLASLLSELAAHGDSGPPRPSEA